MILASLGLAASAAFAGAALYINWSEQPARLALDNAAMLKEWKPSYGKGFEMQASLALVGGALGVAGYFVEHSLAAGLAGLLMLANWPYTLAVMAPVNKRLGATLDADAGPDTRALVVRWGRLHAIRTGLGLTAAAAFLAATVR